MARQTIIDRQPIKSMKAVKAEYPLTPREVFKSPTKSINFVLDRSNDEPDISYPPEDLKLKKKGWADEL